jgi:cytochrome c oxidase subunit IV
MILKAGFIVAIFMHMAWERLALIYAILGPPVVLLVLIGLMAVEGDYTELTRLTSFSAPPAPVGIVEHEGGHGAGEHEAAH